MTADTFRRAAAGALRSLAARLDGAGSPTPDEAALADALRRIAAAESRAVAAERRAVEALAVARSAHTAIAALLREGVSITEGYVENNRAQGIATDESSWTLNLPRLPTARAILAALEGTSPKQPEVTP